jgi:transcriptional regulator with XRE-family HTH domain
MPRNANVIGRTVARLRYQQGWSQDELVAQLHLLGNINMTRDILANIETLRSPADSKQIEFLAEVFHIQEQALFPKRRHFVGKPGEMELREFTRRRRSAPQGKPR